MAEELFDIGVQCGTPDVRAVIVTAHRQDVLRRRRSCRNGRRPRQTRASDPNGHAAACRVDPACADRRTDHHGGETEPQAAVGFSVVLSGDYVIASEKAKFVSAYTSSGLTPDGSSTYYLAKHVGLLRAKELMLTNRVLSAVEGAGLGLGQQGGVASKP